MAIPALEENAYEENLVRVIESQDILDNCLNAITPYAEGLDITDMEHAQATCKEIREALTSEFENISTQGGEPALSGTLITAFKVENGKLIKAFSYPIEKQEKDA